MAWTEPPRTWVASEVVTAAMMNTHVRDQLKAIGDPWTSFGAAATHWTATTTNPTIGNGTFTAAYMQAGKLIHFRIRIVFGSTTTVGSGSYLFGLPVNGQGFNTPLLCTAMLYDSSGSARTMSQAYMNSATQIVLNTGTANVTHAAPIAWATSDVIAIAGTYEAA